MRSNPQFIEEGWMYKQRYKLVEAPGGPGQVGYSPISLTALFGKLNNEAKSEFVTLTTKDVDDSNFSNGMKLYLRPVAKIEDHALTFKELKGLKRSIHVCLFHKPSASYLRALPIEGADLTMDRIGPYGLDRFHYNPKTKKFSLSTYHKMKIVIGDNNVFQTHASNNATLLSLNPTIEYGNDNCKTFKLTLKPILANDRMNGKWSRYVKYDRMSKDEWLIIHV